MICSHPCNHWGSWILVIADSTICQKGIHTIKQSDGNTNKSNYKVRIFNDFWWHSIVIVWCAGK